MPEFRRLFRHCAGELANSAAQIGDCFAGLPSGLTLRSIRRLAKFTDHLIPTRVDVNSLGDNKITRYQNNSSGTKSQRQRGLVLRVMFSGLNSILAAVHTSSSEALGLSVAQVLHQTATFSWRAIRVSFGVAVVAIRSLGPACSDADAAVKKAARG